MHARTRVASVRNLTPGGAALSLFACSGAPGGGASPGAGGVGGVGLPVERAVRGDHPRGAVRPGGRRGQRRVQGHVPLRRAARRAVRRPRAARPDAGMPLQVLSRMAVAATRAGGRVEAVSIDYKKQFLILWKY